MLDLDLIAEQGMGELGAAENAAGNRKLGEGSSRIFGRNTNFSHES